MKSYSLLLCAALALTACSGDGTNPFDKDDEDTTDQTSGTGDDNTADTADIPDSLRGDLERLVYDSATQTLTITGVNLASGDYEAAYTRDPSLDIYDPGGNLAYVAYATQSDPLDRPAMAFVMESGNSSSVRGGMVITGGQFNRYFGGTFYERDGDYTPPASGLVSYAGTYVGGTNIHDTGGGLQPLPSGTNPSLESSYPAIIVGEVFLNVDFGNNSVNGSIYNRDFRGYAGVYTLPDIVLTSTGIAADGTFFGETVEYDGILNNDIGDYGGIFGGPNADGVAGGVHLTEFDGQGDPLGFDSEEEYGTFVLDKCGTPDANATICSSVSP
ncbi:hypothetical protein SAMN05216196_101621 [Lutimaribacter pacificus]|uniref:Thymidylate synthase n=1 Tax=Lutimaribacter pacificus TaxID=391948 RepID=A0A1H0BLW4_9RHOB|nr:thymidylate synthase [Lutimaribacter pacificus]SDN46649.1 hypothetical protein SAMN05216196_101621 [Lutimaribacter pacificus]SHJ54618.1 hypothetical protein SAMN05444142_101596 [Lutimaribacter pacificus]